MRLLVPLLILAWPLAEIAAFVAVGSHIGVLATIALVIATAIAGGMLMRVQGLGALQRIQDITRRGDVPGRELVHGVMILLAGLLLLLPGFLTDILGLLLFIPPIRDAVWRILRSRIHIVTTNANFRGASRNGRTIDLDEDDFRRDPPNRDRLGPH